ncbi:MAG TPA: ATP-binding protein [Gaiellaceae bacterium]|nr:ATP-binding protein [Gaiellaceae bacterium]
MTGDDTRVASAAVIRGASLAASMAVAFLVLLADLQLPPDLNPALLYTIAIVGAAWIGDRRCLWAIAALCCVLTFVAPLLWSAPGTVTAGAATNRVFAATAILAVTVAVHLLMGQRARAREVAGAAAQRNVALEETNLELSAREEEIARQNEELLSQSEELERQSEELRLVNEDLATRERILAQLLDLSRSLAKEITSAHVMTVLCAALTEFATMEGAAAAILVRKGADLEVRCHHGFGTSEALAPLPFEHSFASLVMSRGTAAFIEDLTLRPDVRHASPPGGLEFRSVLAAPLWVRGVIVGTIELYCPRPHRWTEEQVALITSIAAQASISLETARLFEEVEHERRRFETVFRTLPVAVLVADDPKCRHVSGNPAAAALFTAPVDANFSPFAPPGDLIRRTDYREGRPLGPEEFPLVRALRLREHLQGEEFEIAFADGRRIAVLASTAPIYDAGGAVVGGVCAFADITGQKRLERDLEARRRESEEASARKTRFLAAASHDIRTPANAIRLLAEIIKRTARTPGDGERLSKLADDLDRNAAALVDLVGEALDLARFDSGKIDLLEVEFSLGELIAQECEQLRPGADAKEIRLVCEPSPTSLWVRTDRVKLARVLGNLVDNAIKFTERGAVHVSAGLTPDGGLEIRVRDTGPGVPVADRDRIFDDFFQGVNPARDHSRGRGLGLAICRRLVHAMGGTIHLEDAAGGGSEFIVALPRAVVVAGPPRGQGPARGDRPRRPSEGLRGLRVLVVEDHASTREALGQILASEGALVTAVRGGAAALEAARSLDPHFILLDLMLPDIDGTEVLKVIRAAPPPTLCGVIVLSGDFASRHPEDLTRLGAAAVFAKPIDPEAVILRLRAIAAETSADR